MAGHADVNRRLDPRSRRASGRTRRARRLALLLSTAASCLWATGAHAQWSVDAALERFVWRERVQPLGVRELGPRTALGVGFTQRREQGLVFGYRAGVYGGGVTYNGSLQFDPTTPARGTSVYLGMTQTPEVRYRRAGAVDVVAGLELEVWRRRLSRAQREDYRLLSVRLGVDRPASGASPIIAGVGLRGLLTATERVTISEAGVPRHLTLSPGLGWDPYLRLGYRVSPRVTALAYWDRLRLGRSNLITLSGTGPTQVIVFQPESEAEVVGLRVGYGF